MLVAIITCSPWKGETRLEALASPRCAQEKSVGCVNTVFNVISNLYLLFLPVNIVRELQMPTGNKIGVMSLFMFGLL